MIQYLLTQIIYLYELTEPITMEQKVLLRLNGVDEKYINRDDPYVAIRLHGRLIENDNDFACPLTEFVTRSGHVINSGSARHREKFFKHAEIIFQKKTYMELTNKLHKVVDSDVNSAVKNMLKYNNLGLVSKMDIPQTIFKINKPFKSLQWARNFIIHHCQEVDKTLAVVCRVNGQLRLFFLLPSDDNTVATVKINDVMVRINDYLKSF